MLRTWTLLTMLLALGCLCCAMPGVAQDEDSPAPTSVPPPDEGDFSGAVVDDEEADEEEPDYTWDPNASLGVGDDGAAAAKAAAGVAAASGLAMVGFFMIWFILYFGFIMFLVLFNMAVLVATILAIYDCARRDFPDPDTRALWCILIVLTRWLGPLIYYVAVYRKGEPPIQPARTAAPEVRG